MPSESIWMHHHRSSWPDLVEETSLGRCCFHGGGPLCTALWRTSWLESSSSPAQILHTAPHYTNSTAGGATRLQLMISNSLLINILHKQGLTRAQAIALTAAIVECGPVLPKGCALLHISWLLPNSIAGYIDHQGHQFDSLLSAQDKPCEKCSTSWRTLREEKPAAKSFGEDRSTRRVM